jgi:o-succinylbenzoate---CoA ligase
MNLFPEHIILNRQKISVAEFLETSSKKTEIEKEIAGFLKEWYSKENFIKVKTSGSTGTPKTIRLTKNFVAASAQRTIRFFRLKEGDCVLYCLPTKYIAGKLMIVRALLGGLDLHIVEPTTDFSFLQTRKFRFAAMVSNQVKKILNSEPEKYFWIQNIDQLLIGGSSVSHSLEKQLQNVPIACWSSYGMTETATHIALRIINGSESDEYYRCLDDIKIQISDDGCLLIFMPGLSEQPLYTTDLAVIKDEKTFKILGRRDNIIISGGIKFSPEELEKKLAPFIKQPFFISSRIHDLLGHQLVLVIEGLENQELISKLWPICRQKLGKYEQPRQIIFIQKIPKTSSGKIKRKDLQL